MDNVLEHLISGTVQCVENIDEQIQFDVIYTSFKGRKIMGANIDSLGQLLLGKPFLLSDFLNFSAYNLLCHSFIISYNHTVNSIINIRLLMKDGK